MKLIFGFFIISLFSLNTFACSDYNFTEKEISNLASYRDKEGLIESFSSAESYPVDYYNHLKELAPERLSSMTKEMSNLAAPIKLAPIGPVMKELIGCLIISTLNFR